MIKVFLKERWSWIAFFVFMHFFILLVAYLDVSIAISSILYIIFLNSILFFLFLFSRYQREVAFFKELAELNEESGFSELSSASRPFEKMVEISLNEYSDRLKRNYRTQLSYLEDEKDELLAWIHEVKTPMTAMKLMIDRMEDKQLKKQLTYEWLRIHLLLDQQLHRKKIPSIQNDLFMETVDVEELIFAELRTLQSWCIQKGLGFEVELTDKLVISDKKWLSFILRQVLSNAVKYSELGDIEVKSIVESDQMQLSIKDNGRGITPRDLPRIFDKGFTSTISNQTPAATGMGLFLTKKAADALSIGIKVESAPNAGSTFTLIFSKKNEFTGVWSM
ncbi:sensor histidine kinase [Sutcliffiella rhizosphaerae]|uniref:histidine kinase n=1 Tax=Sutcliffiella rhizosphaerae TaxID=2880967 RepID=A0ABN8A4E8_9BACI|nr:sensor histidine kinase [Sutcliffiella rhizosphaerae]CAG9619978.1 Sensor histidine kinase GraS [Sutcliffiella rhizosphaerae]